MGEELDVADRKEEDFKGRGCCGLEEGDGGSFEFSGLIMSGDGLKIRKRSLVRFGMTHVGERRKR